jgi:hypothetical protein
MSPQNRARLDDKAIIQPRAKRSAKFATILGALALILVAGGMWANQRLVGLMDRISPSYDASTSMEPYEIVLSSRLVDGRLLPDDVPPVEWILKLPRAFIVKEFGTPGTVDGVSKTNSFYSVYIHANVDAQTKQVAPAIFASNKSATTTFLGIELQNNGAQTEVIRHDLCLPLDDLARFIESKGGGTAPANKLCLDSNRSCWVQTHYQGWDLRLLVEKKSEFYRTPETACEFAKEFLAKNQIKIDAKTMK